MQAVDPAAIRGGAAALLGRTPARGLLRRASLLPPSEAPTTGDTREVTQLLRSESFRASVLKLADGLDLTEAAAMAEAAGYLREMSATPQPKVTDAWQRFG